VNIRPPSQGNAFAQRNGAPVCAARTFSKGDVQRDGKIGLNSKWRGESTRQANFLLHTGYRPNVPGMFAALQDLQAKGDCGNRSAIIERMPSHSAARKFQRRLRKGNDIPHAHQFFHLSRVQTNIHKKVLQRHRTFFHLWRQQEFWRHHHSSGQIFTPMHGNKLPGQNAGIHPAHLGHV